MTKRSNKNVFEAICIRFRAAHEEFALMEATERGHYMRRPAMIILLFALSLIEKDYSSIEEVDADLKFVCKEVAEAAMSLIQKKKIKQGAKVKDPTLSHLCWKCRCTFRTWKHAGRPTCGPVSDERKQCKRAVKSYMHEQVLLMQMTFSSAG